MKRYVLQQGRKMSVLHFRSLEVFWPLEEGREDIFPIKIIHCSLLLYLDFACYCPVFRTCI